MEHINEGKQYGAKAGMIDHGKHKEILRLLHVEAIECMKDKGFRYEDCTITVKAYNTYENAVPITEGYFKIEVNTHGAYKR